MRSDIEPSARVPWLVKRRLFIAAFEQLYFRTHRKKICRKMLEHDLFDGRAYRLDEFVSHVGQYVERPHDFYTTAARPESVSL